MNSQQKNDLDSLAKKSLNTKVSKKEKPVRKSPNKQELNQAFKFNGKTGKFEVV